LRAEDLSREVFLGWNVRKISSAIVQEMAEEEQILKLRWKIEFIKKSNKKEYKP
jgi:hypothetical protein